MDFFGLMGISARFYSTKVLAVIIFVVAVTQLNAQITDRTVFDMHYSFGESIYLIEPGFQDDDHDGVINQYDVEPASDTLSVVDVRGAMLDSDGDGCLDHIDPEPMSSPVLPIEYCINVIHNVCWEMTKLYEDNNYPERTILAFDLNGHLLDAAAYIDLQTILAWLSKQGIRKGEVVILRVAYNYSNSESFLLALHQLVTLLASEPTVSSGQVRLALHVYPNTPEYLSYQQQQGQTMVAIDLIKRSFEYMYDSRDTYIRDRW